MSQNKSPIESAFREWWSDAGSGIAPFAGEEQSAHAERVAKIAWLNGAAIALRNLRETFPPSVKPLTDAEKLHAATLAEAKGA